MHLPQLYEGTTSPCTSTKVSPCGDVFPPNNDLIIREYGVLLLWTGAVDRMKSRVCRSTFLQSKSPRFDVRSSIN